MTELELKFRLPDAALPALRSALLEHGARRTRLQARYFDTADGLLAQHHIALRLRLEGRRWVQTLKAAGEGAVHRLEDEVPIAGPAKQVPVLDPSRHVGSDAGRALQAVLQSAPEALLIERHATDVWRLHVLLRDAGGTQVEAALDVGSVSSGARSTPIVELELEHKGGPVQGLFDVATAWVSHHGLWLSTITKAHRGQRLLKEPATGGESARAVSAGRPLWVEGGDGAHLLRALLQSTLDQVLANASEVAEGVVDAPVIHQLRVGLRRLRTVVRELAALSPMLNAALDAPLSAAFAQLGQQRDLQALGPAVQPLLRAADAPLSTLPATPAADPVAAVRETAFQTTLITLLALAHAGDERFARLSHKEMLRHVARRLDKLHRGLADESKHFEALPIARQHRARKRLKRLRYLAELTAALWPRKASVRGYLKRLRAAQNALGAHNDVAAAADAFRGAASGQPEAWFAAGYLQAHLAVTARHARQALVKVADGGRFWT